MTKGMTITSLVLLGSLAMILSASAAPPLGALEGKKLSELLKPPFYGMLRKFAKDADKKIACIEAKPGKIPLSVIAEIKEFALKVLHDLPPTDPEMTILIQSFDNDPRVAEHLPVVLKNVFQILNCAT